MSRHTTRAGAMSGDPTMGPAASRHGDLPLSSLVPFVVAVFVLAWGILGLFLFLPGAMEGRFGPLSSRHPLFILAVYAPAITAVALVAHATGVDGLRRYLARLLLWRAPAAWYAFLLLGIPVIFLAGAAVGGTLSLFPLGSGAPGTVLAAMVFMLFLGPVEELGWRGVALPLLQRRLAPIWAGLALGIVWGLWHLPAFFLSGAPQNAWAFTPFFMGAIAVSVIVTPLFNASRGSILLAVLFHFQLNNPLWPDGQPWDMWIFVVVAALVTWVNRETMFSRAGAVTRVVPEPRGQEDPPIWERAAGPPGPVRQGR